MTQIINPRQRLVIMKNTLRLKLQERLLAKKNDNFKGLTPSSLQDEPRWVGWCLEDNKIPKKSSYQSLCQNEPTRNLGNLSASPRLGQG